MSNAFQSRWKDFLRFILRVAIICVLCISGLIATLILLFNGVLFFEQIYSHQKFATIEAKVASLGGYSFLDHDVVYAPKLTLEGPNIDDHALAELANLCRPFTYVHVYLNDTAVTPAGIRTFLTGQPHWDIRDLIKQETYYATNLPEAK